MPAAFLITDDEMRALDGEPHAARVLYFELRRRMDFATGLVGRKKGAGVSWQALREALYIEPGQGIAEAGAPSKAAIRRLAERLERAGLIRLESRDRRLVVRCRLARIASPDNSASKKPGTNPAQTRHTETGTQHGTDAQESYRLQELGKALDETSKPGTDPGTNPAQQETEKPGTPLVSGVCGGSSREQGSIPSDRADRAEINTAFQQTIARLGAEVASFNVDHDRDAVVLLELERELIAHGVNLVQFDNLVRERHARHPVGMFTPGYFLPIVRQLGASLGRQESEQARARETGSSPDDDRAVRARDEAALFKRAAQLGLELGENEGVVEFRLRVDKAHRAEQTKRQREQAEVHGRSSGLQSIKTILEGVR